MKLGLKRRAVTGLAIAATALLALSGCANTGGADGGATGGADGKSARIGFFGFAASNSFAQGVFTGIQEQAKKEGAEATFVDGQFDGQLQAQQINDAVTAKSYDVMIVEANDNLVLQEPLKKAIAAGITVVVEFVPVGPKFDTIDPQVEGAVSVVDTPVGNGALLGQLATEACKGVKAPCKVAYMEGSPALPLDNARTASVKAEIEKNTDMKLVQTVTGGYAADQGRTAFQDIMQSNPDVNVVIGSTQALAGAATVAGKDSGIKFVGNGSPQSAVDRVLAGEWFAIVALDVVKNGATAAEYGLKHFRGEDVPTATDERTLAPDDAIGTRENLEKSGFKSGYNE